VGSSRSRDAQRSAVSRESLMGYGEGEGGQDVRKKSGRLRRVGINGTAPRGRHAAGVRGPGAGRAGAGRGRPREGPGSGGVGGRRAIDRTTAGRGMRRQHCCRITPARPSSRRPVRPPTRLGRAGRAKPPWRPAVARRGLPWRTIMIGRREIGLDTLLHKSRSASLTRPAPPRRGPGTRAGPRGSRGPSRCRRRPPWAFPAPSAAPRTAGR
jgi:hypothetical protein